jgi:hypothetical protein
MKKNNVKVSQRGLGRHLKNKKRKERAIALKAFNDMVRPFKERAAMEAWIKEQEKIKSENESKESTDVK